MTDRRTPSPKLSLCVCTYFEEECIEAFIDNVHKELDGKIDYEIVFTDDGSTDRTVELIEARAEEDHRIKLVVLTRNHGKNSAVTSCIAHASGEYMIMMDPDLQDPPNMILSFVEKIEEGYDIVYGIREKKADSLLNTLFSKVFWSSLNWFTGLAIPKNLAVMRCFNRDFAEHYLSYPERIRFVEGIFFDIGMRQTTLSVPNLQRFAGVSKFTFLKKLNLAGNAIIAFSDRPIKLMTIFGAFLFALSGLYTFKAVIRRFFFDEIPNGWTSTIVAIVGIGSVQMIMLGLIGAYLGKTYTESKKRPVFRVQRRINLPPPSRLGQHVPAQPVHNNHGEGA